MQAFISDAHLFPHDDILDEAQSDVTDVVNKRQTTMRKEVFVVFQLLPWFDNYFVLIM